MADAFLRLPPYPGHRAGPLAVPGTDSGNDDQPDDLVDLLKASRVGGDYWSARPALPAGRDLVLIPSSQSQALEMVEASSAQGRANQSVIVDLFGFVSPSGSTPIIVGAVDWWHISNAAAEIWVDGDHEIALVAALSGRGVKTFGEGKFAAVGDDRELARIAANEIGKMAYACPFTGEAISSSKAIELLADWRRLIDRNRGISAVYGIASWKRPTIDPMLWNGISLPMHGSAVVTASAGNTALAAWKSRTSEADLDRIAGGGLPVAEIEDGMIRGRGLGANCVPPLSIVVDFSGIYFDPAQPSDLEQILETAEMDAALIDRAIHLRQSVINAGISKYDGGTRSEFEPSGGRLILVLGQVEDDRSILSGAPGQTNLGLLERARQLEPGARLIYRPHPDVEAGHRKGHVPDRVALQFADEIERGGSITALIEAADGVHCITSLGGFEALLRGKKVTTHGVPFYAGWGLTTDLGPIPSRRTRRRSLDELVAATLILYPIYFDPVTRLPCPPEILVSRIARGEDSFAAPLAWLRSSQGKLKVALRRIWEAA